MAEKFKVGDKVRILDKDEIVGAESFGFKTNEIYPVVRLDSQGDPVITNGTEELSIFTSELQYLEKVSDKPTKNQRISALEKEVAALKEEVEALKKAQGKTVTLTISIELNQQASANSLRKAIIDEAKEFVEENLTKNHPDAAVSGVWFTNKNSCLITDRAEFIVNDKKRAVVVLIKGVDDNDVYTKGIAKCAPDDVFNEHIGKAIALGRALGLDVSKFENAVKPTEVVVGMRVTNIPNAMYETTEGSYVVGRIKDGNAYDAYTKDGEGWIPVNLLQILDDTEAQYE